MADNGALRKPPGFRDSSTAPLKPPPQAAAAATAAAPRKPVAPPSYYRPQKKRRGCCFRCCCCFLCVIFVFLLLLVAFIGLFYAWYQPKIPVFRFRPIELDRFNITAKPDGTAVLDSQITIRFEVNNPNGKMSIYYGETKVTLTGDKETQLGSASYPEFKQPANNVTLLRFTAVQKTGVDSTTGKKLKDRVKSEQMEVNAAVNTKVGIGVFNKKVGMIPVNVNCGGVTLKELNGGKTSPKCSFNTLWGW